MNIGLFPMSGIRVCDAELLRLAGKRREVGQALELLEGIFESSRWNG